MKLIDEVKKLRDECKSEEEYYNERFNLWMKYCVWVKTQGK